MIALLESVIAHYSWLLEFVLLMAVVILLIAVGPMLSRSLRQWRNLRRPRRR